VPVDKGAAATGIADFENGFTGTCFSPKYPDIFMGTGFRVREGILQ
jgi:hypothetical protein